MKSQTMISLLEKTKKHFHVIGTENDGLIIGLSLEGRIFTVMEGEVVSRVNPDIFEFSSTREQYINPGGDGLWPAPEGTCLGYEYPTGKWRVPPGITGADYRVVSSDCNGAVISAEIDLINNQGLGIPTIFSRHIKMQSEENKLIMDVTETIEYIGARELNRQQCFLAPWSLSQFDCGKNCMVVMPEATEDSLWDLYEPSDSQRYAQNGFCHIKTEGSLRFQVGIGREVEWIEFVDPGRKLKVLRKAEPVSNGFDYVDIADRPPSEKPQKRGVRYSVYNDNNFFMEIEAAGGIPHIFAKNTLTSVSVSTIFKKLKE